MTTELLLLMTYSVGKERERGRVRGRERERGRERRRERERGRERGRKRVVY